jgi:hypothetical protein
MNRYIALFGLLLAFKALPGFGQNQTDISLEDLRTPAAPGFILLDVAPTSIEKPTTPKAFAVSVLNAANLSNGIPKNFAMEFTPFWFLKHPNMNAIKFYGINAETKKQKVFYSLRNASLSIAAVDTSTASVSTSNRFTKSNIAFGLRTTILSIRKKADIDDLVAANNDIVKALNGIATTIALISPSDPEREIKIQRLIDEGPLPQNKRLKEVLARKPVFALDGAVAANIAHTNTNYNSGRLGRAGGWLNANLALPIKEENANEVRNYLHLLATTRYLSNNDSINASGEYVREDLFDTGARVELEIGKLSISYEFLLRNNLTTDANTIRSSGLIQYRLGNGVYINGAIGKNFGTTNNLIALFGINWGLGNEKTVVNRSTDNI